MKQQINEIKRMQQLAGVLNENEAISASQWPNMIRNYITTELSDDEKELYQVIKSLEKTLESFKEEMGEYDPDFHYGEGE